jgi:hypothetical protein
MEKLFERYWRDAVLLSLATAFAAGLLSLTGCATPNGQTRVQTVYCVTPEQYKTLVDAEPAKVGNIQTGDLQTDYKTSVRQNVLVRQYADGLLQVLGGCMSPVQDK